MSTTQNSYNTTQFATHLSMALFPQEVSRQTAQTRHMIRMLSHMRQHRATPPLPAFGAHVLCLGATLAIEAA